MDFHSLMGRAATMMLGKRNDDGIADRLTYRYTVGILVAFAIINMNRLYTDQIKCWVKISMFNTMHFLFCITITFLFVSIRYPHFLHQTMMNMFDPYASFRILTMYTIQQKHLNHIMLKKKLKYCIINGSHLF
jgi:hypothetical protein